jgi:dihydrofolate synthase/folylpolyglutamate synthase
MTYQETLEFLFSQLPAYHRIGKAAYKGDLDTTLAFDEYLGHPHRKFHSIHVGGTNGKGSVSHMLASVLREAGFRTGLYTSPHLVDFRERIKVDGMMISENYVVDFVEKNSDIIERLRPSFFEMTVALAFDYFNTAEVDVAVIEVGLGGRLDSTNIITPVLSVITNIGHDHMDLLGDTLEKVAAEKAGIIKDGVPVVVSETGKETSQVFVSQAALKKSRICFADQVYECMAEETYPAGGQREYSVRRIDTGRKYNIRTLLSGDYQAKNIQAVFAACEFLKTRLGISENNVIEGIGKVIENTGFAGRWQVLGKTPLIICDTGHNKEGIEYVIQQLGRINTGRLHIILGFVNDKDLSEVLPLFPFTATYYFTKASVPRALNEKILREKASVAGLIGDSYPDVAAAISAARNNSTESDVIFVGGSTFVVADALL